MKTMFSFLLVLIASCAKGKNVVYVGSTPAHHVVRSFLRIPLTDSIDFIRWKITFQEDKYLLACNYGIGKPNTNGFINDGKWIELRGVLKKEENYYLLKNGNRVLRLLELSSSLLHLLDDNNNMLVGNGGWSYTLNIENSSAPSQINLAMKQTILKDSMAFQGRTPCLQFATVKQGTTCYKLKWWIVLYADSKTNKPTTYYLNGTAVEHKGKTGTWTIIRDKKGNIIYKLGIHNNEALYLLKPGENILLFADKQGNLLIGDKDFSFTLNRTW